jgi:hypothetical protein
MLVADRPMRLSIPSAKVIHYNSNLYYLCAGTTALRPVTEIAQERKEMTDNERKHIEKR